MNEHAMLIKEIEDWSRAVQHIMENKFAFRDNPNSDAERATWSPFEDTSQSNENLRAILSVLNTLFKIALQRQASLLEQNHELLKRLVQAELMRQISARSNRLSQALAIDPDECVSVPFDSIINDAATMETLASNLRMVLQYSSTSLCRSWDNSNAPDGFDTVVRAPAPSCGSLDSISQPSPRLANPPPPPPPPPLQPGGLERSTSHDMPMPRFASARSGEDVQAFHLCFVVVRLIEW
eukprot:CAMPEP_0169127044 /NCGR_PEP_ID=MMETSP1015-20121227/35789_1 /TAXON_ID=342587 /ORGANISM="Karlodinium micrum, Strain CCMP2283" /LENGTH=237 /DNA_ID=CAMNT_0009190783 /DNA_START=46 /DNA_END=756 /DNA_ORIENTATION=-